MAYGELMDLISCYLIAHGVGQQAETDDEIIIPHLL